MYLIKICTAKHSGGLLECLRTEKEISLAVFLQIINEYEYYCFDERIKAHRFLIKDLKNNFVKERDWINVYLIEKIKCK